MLMHMGHDCHCKQPFPDCFYCPVFEKDIPEQWVLDMPTSLSYLGATMGSCSATTPITGISITYRSWSLDYEYPDLTGFGTATPLDLDDAARSSIYTPITECVWGSSGYSFYEERSGGVVEGGSLGCSPGSVVIGDKNADIPVSDCWQYGANNGTTPPYYSLGRVRTAIPFTFPDCGALQSGCTPIRSCGIRPFGIWAVLRVVKPFSSPARLTVLIFWYPRALLTDVTYSRNIPFPWRPSLGSSRWTQELTATGTFPACVASLYPYATSADNVFGPGAILYDKQIECDEDFTGSPVVLSLIGVTKKYSSSTQNVFEAAGITGLPSSITITPV